MRELRDRVAVITGAGNGAGRALALHAATVEGMRVVVADIEGEAAGIVAREIAAAGGAALPVRVDVADAASIEALAQAAYARFGAVNLVWNNAGVSHPMLLANASESDWEWLLSVNLRGVLNGVRAFLPRMRAQGAAEGERHIVNTASVSGLVARRNEQGIYTTTKHAVVGFTNVLRDELASEGIVVSCWCPGGMATSMRSAGRRRQAQFGGPFQTALRSLDRPPPETIVPRVFQAIREDRRYIFSHPQTRPDVEEYYAQIRDDYDAAERIAKQVG